MTPLTSTLVSLLAAYYADADPARLPIIADAMEEIGRVEDAEWVRDVSLPHRGGQHPRTVFGRIRNRFPIVQRTIAEYGCVICQTWHDEDSPLFWQHIDRHGKHQGPREKDVEGQWVEHNTPYWTRRPVGVAAE